MATGEENGDITKEDFQELFKKLKFKVDYEGMIQ